MEIKVFSRRDFIKVAGTLSLGVASMGILGALGGCTKSNENDKTPEQTAITPPEGLIELSETDGMAQALGYVMNAESADKTKFPKYQAGQQCQGCSLFVDKGNSAYGGCNIFAGKAVKKAGWCNSFAPKA